MAARITASPSRAPSPGARRRRCRDVGETAPPASPPARRASSPAAGCGNSPSPWPKALVVLQLISNLLDQRGDAGRPASARRISERKCDRRGAPWLAHPHQRNHTALRRASSDLNAGASAGVGKTIERRIHTSRPGGGSARCSASRTPDPRRSFFQPTPPSTTPSTYYAISSQPKPRPVASLLNAALWRLRRRGRGFWVISLDFTCVWTRRVGSGYRHHCATRPSQIAAKSFSNPGRQTPDPERPRSSSMTLTLAQPSCPPVLQGRDVAALDGGGLRERNRRRSCAW